MLLSAMPCSESLEAIPRGRSVNRYLPLSDPVYAGTSGQVGAGADFHYIRWPPLVPEVRMIEYQILEAVVVGGEQGEICLAGGSSAQRLGDSRHQSSSSTQTRPTQTRQHRRQGPDLFFVGSSKGTRRCEIIDLLIRSWQHLASASTGPILRLPGFLVSKPMSAVGLLESLSRMGV
jgi:hypothetical protein